MRRRHGYPNDAEVDEAVDALAVLDSAVPRAIAYEPRRYPVSAVCGDRNSVQLGQVGEGIDGGACVPARPEFHPHGSGLVEFEMIRERVGQIRFFFAEDADAVDGVEGVLCLTEDLATGGEQSGVECDPNSHQLVRVARMRRRGLACLSTAMGSSESGSYLMVMEPLAWSTRLKIFTLLFAGSF